MPKTIAKRLRASPLGYRLAQGAFWSLMGAGISRGLVLAASIVIARYLGKEGYGELGIIQSTVGTFGTLASFGLGTTTTKYIAELRSSDPHRAGRILGLSRLVATITGGSMAMVLFLLAPWLATNSLAAPHLQSTLRWAAPLLFLSTMNGAPSGILAGFEAFKAIGMRSFWAGMVQFPLMAGGVYLAGLNGAVWALTADSAVNWVLNYLAIRREAAAAGISLSIAGCTREADILWHFSVPAVLSVAMMSPVTWACSTMLVNQPAGYAEMGIYNAAYTFHRMIFIVGTTLGAPLLPMISHGRDSSATTLGRINMLFTWFLGLIPSLFLLSFPELVGLLYGEQFGGSSFQTTLIIIMLATCIRVNAQGMSRILLSSELMWYAFANNAIWGVAFLVGFYFLVRLASVGLAIAFLISYFLATVIFIPLYTYRELVPRDTIISFDAALIWLAVMLSSATSYFNVSIIVRIFLFPVFLVMFIYLFYRLLQMPRAARENVSTLA